MRRILEIFLSLAFCGWVIDQFAQFNFTHPGAHTAIDALREMFVGNGAGAARFALLCPGGTAPAGSPTELVTQCSSALKAASRSGLIITYCFLLWAAFHYYLGSIGLAAALAKARAARGETT